MWTKNEKGGGAMAGGGSAAAADALFVGPSSAAAAASKNHFDLAGAYFKYHHHQLGGDFGGAAGAAQQSSSSSSTTPPNNSSCIAWKANSARRKRFEPFCSPVAPHVPIRQRLSSRRCTSVDASNDGDPFMLSSSNPYLVGRRRRMSLLQTLRYQNKQLADSSYECQQTERPERDAISPAAESSHRRYNSDSPPPPPPPPSSLAIQEEESTSNNNHKTSTTTLSFNKLKAKTKALFGKKPDRKSHSLEQRIAPSDTSSSRCPTESDRALYSRIDFSAKGKPPRKSQSTNDSGHGSPGRLCTDEEHPDYIQVSCPQLGLNLRIYHEIFRRAISMRNRGLPLESDSEEDDDEEQEEEEEDDDDDDDDVDYECRTGESRQQYAEVGRQGRVSPRSEKSEEAEGIVQREEIKFAERMLRNSSPLSAADFLLEKRLQMRALLMQRQQEASEITKKQQQHPQQHQQQHPQQQQQQHRTTTTVVQETGSGTSGLNSATETTTTNFTRNSPERVDGSKRVDDAPHNRDDDLSSVKLDRGSVMLNETDAHSTSTRASEEFDEDDNASTILLDQYLPILSELYPRGRNRSQRSSSQSSALNRSEEDDDITTCVGDSGKVGSVTQTDLSLIRISEQLSAYLNELGLGGTDEEIINDREGMNFLAKHFFEYQSFVNLPHKAVQLHKTPPSQAGSDPSAAWAPKSMNRAGKNQAAPGARANRNNADTRPAAHRHGRAGKHEYREWGDRHGELKPEKIAPHKDALTKFLSNEEVSTKRTIFECDFEDHILQTGPETLPERLSRSTKNDDVELSLPYPEPTNPENSCETEVLTILTYAPQVQFVTATVKKAKCLPFNHRPFARVMLFEGRRLLEQKQTTITPATSCNGCISTGSRTKAPCSNSSTSSSSVSSGSNKSNDALFSESFLFRVSPQMLDRCHIVIEMYDSNPEDPLKGPFPVGHCVVGPMCSGSGCTHWYQMVRKSGLPVCMWHRMMKG